MTFYAEGYDEAAVNRNILIDCFPDNYDASDVPFTYYAGTKDKAEFNKDLIDFQNDLFDGNLPSVSFIKAVGRRTGHPACGRLKAVQEFLSGIHELIQKSEYANSTLLISAEDESGGFYDPVKPPETSPTDNI
jgi:phospholipase C